MDLVLRATFGFVFIFVMTRLIGRRELGKLQAFDLILFIVIGDLVQQGISAECDSITGMTLVICDDLPAHRVRLIRRASGSRACARCSRASRWWWSTTAS